jgi:octaprenyl-diphosphate synthase
MDYIKVQEPVLSLLKSTEMVLAKQIGSKVPLIAELQRCTPVGKGKKIRAAFFFLLAGMNRLQDKDLPRLAAAIEMLHLSSLVHDDIVDNSTRRRGEKTPNHHFGNYLSVLWGDYLFINSLHMLASDRRNLTMNMLLGRFWNLKTISITKSRPGHISQSFVKKHLPCLPVSPIW